MRLISRTYIKIFLTFWLVTIFSLVGASLLAHYFGLGPTRHINHSDSGPMGDAGGRLLRELVSDAVNLKMEDFSTGVHDMPAWATRHIYVLDSDGRDLLQRPLPGEVAAIAERLSLATPLLHDDHNQLQIYARRLVLSDGQQLSLIVIAPEGSSLGWRLYFHNLWHVMLLSIILSGVACYLLARYMTRDIASLKEAAQQIARGNWDRRIARQLCNRSGEIGELGRAFDDMMVKLQRTMHEQRRLIKDVSHELRTPLARLQVALAIAQQRANSDIQTELERIKRAADYLNDVISNILTLPLTEQDSWELDDVVEISGMLRVVTNANRHEAEQKQVHLDIHDHLQEALVQTRGNTLAGVFDNVIRNAVRYTAPGTPISISLTREADKCCRITIADRGPGVQPDQLEDIFEPFFRTDEARCRSKGGYGLGLAIAKRTVDLHRGTIKAELNHWGGLSVSVSLPCEDTVNLIADRPDGEGEAATTTPDNGPATDPADSAGRRTS